MSDPESVIDGRTVAGQKRRVSNAYIKALKSKDLSKMDTLKDDFLATLEAEKKVWDYMGVEASAYPIFLDNVFRSLGFGIYIGPLPTISGIQPDHPFHVAFDASRLILIRDSPSQLFAEIAEVQALSSRPILGISHTTWVRVKERSTDDWEQKYGNISTALGIGRLQITSTSMLKAGIKLDPQTDSENLQQIAKLIGLTDFLSLPVDNLPIYGSFRTIERHQTFDEKNVKKMLYNSIERGHRLTTGTITSIEPFKVLENPSTLIRQLNKSDLIVETDKIRITPAGQQYVKDKLLGTAQEAALLKTADLSLLENLRLEFRNLEHKIDESIFSSKKEILTAINEVKLQVKEVGDKRNVTAKYIIEVPPGSPFKFHVELPIGEISEEDLFLKIAEIKAKAQILPLCVVNELKSTIKNLKKIPRNIKESLLTTFQ